MTDRSLTVVVPTYNGTRYLKATLDSLAAQLERPEVLVVDDGSLDDSADVAEEHPIVSRVVRQANRGVAASRNRGLALASSAYVAFMDQDDLWHESRTSMLLDLAASTGASAVATTEQVFATVEDRDALVEAGDPRIDWPSHWVAEGDEGALTRRRLDGSDDVAEISVQRLMRGAAFVTTATMYEREAAIVAGGCAPFVRAADDHVLNVNVANIFGPIAQIQRPALFYRIHPEATSNSSPLVVPLLTLQLALRHGRALPADCDLGHNLRHLVTQIADEPSLSLAEQLALLTLSTSGSERRRWLRQWTRSRVKKAVSARG